MSLDENIYDDPLRFVLIDKAPLHSIYITCQAPSEDVRENWVSQIKSILDMQGDFLRGILIIFYFIGNYSSDKLSVLIG